LASSDGSEIRADIVEEGRRVLDATREAGLTVRLLGGVAVNVRSSGLPPALARPYKDLGSFRMCHEIPLEPRLDVDDDTVPLAELLLTKLQIVQVNEKDVRDTVALLLEHEVTEDDAGLNGTRVAELCAEDWGLWRTITRNLETVRANVAGSAADRDVVSYRLGRLEERIESAPKSRAWRIRAKVGERKRWYELPDEV
jgi:hypothetical protein